MGRVSHTSLNGLCIVLRQPLDFIYILRISVRLLILTSSDIKRRLHVRALTAPTQQPGYSISDVEESKNFRIFSICFFRDGKSGAEADSLGEPWNPALTAQS